MSEGFCGQYRALDKKEGAAAKAQTQEVTGGGHTLFNSRHKMKEIYILTNLNGTHRGVYHSLDELITGTNLWINKVPKETLIYEKWYCHNSKEAITWDYAYVSRHEEALARELADEGGVEVFPSSIGTNLLTENDMLLHKITNAILGLATWIKENPVFTAFVVMSLYLMSAELAWVDNVYENAAALPMFIFAVAVTMAGIWLESRGWELLHNQITGQKDGDQ